MKQRKETQENASPLSPQQEAAMLHLLAGKSQREAAEVAEVTESTVSRWCNHDAAFIAELNKRRAGLWDTHADKLRSLAGRAVDTLEGLLDAGDEKTRLAAATAILKSVALHEGGRPAGPIDAEEIKSQWRTSEVMRSLTAF